MTTNLLPGTYSLTEAHADGRHASSHPEDRAFFVKAGCARCAEDFDVRGLPIVTDDAFSTAEGRATLRALAASGTFYTQEIPASMTPEITF